jgi:integrase
LADGIDPLEARNSSRSRQSVETATMTFDQCAAAYITEHESSWVTGHREAWVASLRDYVSPIIGKLPIAAVDTAAVLRTLKPIWTDKTVTASRTRGRVERILAWAAVHGYRLADEQNPATWKGHLREALPAPKKIAVVVRQPALPYTEMPSFMMALRTRAGMVSLALRFAVLTAVRTHDIRNAEVAHIDREAGVWTIPKFSKSGREHRVPLSDVALAVIDAAVEIVGGIGDASGLLFPSDSGRPLSENSMLQLLARMGLQRRMTTHGARSCFKTWAIERTSFPDELSELCLGHAVRDEVAKAYVRGDALRKRFAIMQAWADYLGRTQQPGKVIPIQGRSA